MDIQGKVAIVTGGGSGIGRATAVALDAAGAAVVIADVDEIGGKETGGMLRRSLFVPTDVTRIDAVRALFEAAEREFGGVDIVHNNAGLLCGEPLWPDTPVERALRLVEVNLGGVVVVLRLAIDALRKRGGGVVVNTASLAAVYPLAEDPPYAATKAAVAMLTRSSAGLASEGIRVNAVLPPLIDTPMVARSGDGTRPAQWVDNLTSIIPLHQPEEVAAVVLDLITDDSLAGHLGTLPQYQGMLANLGF
jgi:NAD(P)-dependent dehydrogenase (short-subunit alcohol dehydrogenase family)